MAIPRIAKMPPIKATVNAWVRLFEVLKINSAGTTVEAKPIKNAQLKGMVFTG